MPSITYDEFDIGLDLRKGASVSDANRLRELKNAYVTKGKVIRKRPGTQLVEDFDTAGEAGTKGLVSGSGYLNTFSEGVPIAHGNSLFRNLRVKHPTTSPQDILSIDYGDIFAGFMYVSVVYADASRWHHWCGGAEPWVGATAYSLGDVVRQVSGTITDRVFKCTVAGTSGGTEPTWPAMGATVADGTVTWTAVSNAIEDPDCPHTPSFTVLSGKVYAIDGENVRACEPLNAREWGVAPVTPPPDGTLIPVSSNTKGSSVSTGVSEYDGRLSVYFSDSVQFYDTDADINSDVYYKSVEGVGTTFPQTAREFAGDTIFLSNSGFRSITTLANSNQNLAETDVGSPIDKLVKPQLTTLLNPFAEFYTAGGQYWCVMRELVPQTVWAYTFSRTQKISAWARYFFEYSIDAMAVNNGILYLRSGEKVYKVNNDETVWTDNGSEYEFRMEMPYLDFKKPGSTKYIASMDIVLQGSVDVQFRFDPNDESLITDKIRLTGDTRPYQSIPVEITCAGVAPVFSITNSEDVQIDSITFYYEELGNV